MELIGFRKWLEGLPRTDEERKQFRKEKRTRKLHKAFEGFTIAEIVGELVKLVADSNDEWSDKTAQVLRRAEKRLQRLDEEHPDTPHWISITVIPMD